MSIQMPPIDKKRVKEISDHIVKSMLARSYPVVNASHFFEKYSIDGKPDPQFAHAMMMMEQGKILRMDTTKKPFSVTFVLLENNKPKMHHMIDDDYGSDTFGSMMNDPYEGDKKRETCWKHLKEGYTANCEKCELEKNSIICMKHNSVLSNCEKCKKTSQLLKDVTPKERAEEIITAILKVYKKQYWSFGN